MNQPALRPLSWAARRATAGLVVILLLAACSGVGGAPPATEPATAQEAAPTQPATGGGTAAPAADLAWQVEIVQGADTHTGDAGDVRLARAPFTLRVLLPQPMAVKLNASQTDDNFQLLQPGYTFVEDCTLALCTGMDMAEETLNPDRWLAVDGFSTHYLYYQSDTDHRWSRTQVDSAGAAFERDVAWLNDLPIEQYPDGALYLLLFADAARPGAIDAGELKKITLLFEQVEP